MSLRDQLKKLNVGMSRKAVSLSPHDANWFEAFSAVDAALNDCVPKDLELHHIGSTSIPGIHAKPILDILGVVPSIEAFDNNRSELESLGFVWKGEYGIAGRRYCVLYDESEEVGLVHLHVFAKSDREVEKHLIFRDYLKATAEASYRYEELKKKLAQSFMDARTNYSEGKSELIAQLLDEAFKWKNNSIDLTPAMNLHSLAYQTDLSILALQGRLENREEYVVAESFGNPGYFWGNLLVMKNAPSQGDYARWIGLFKQEFRHQPLVKHMTFGWDSTDGFEGATEPFVEDGFEIERSVVLTLQQVRLINPKHSCVGLEIRPLVNDKDWEAAVQNQVDCRLQTFKLETFLPFKRIQMKKYRDMSEAGFGHWFGAFLNGKLIGDCGLYVFDGTGRYQAVGTHPDFRKKGVCANLVFETARFGFEKLNAKMLVMVADPEYHAAKVYESVGFTPTEKAIGVYRYPKDQ
ncbi:MAG TPA: GNAT family N-acetyltransferase, partial [Pseudobdellovibrionaceae bacterium]